MTEGLAREGEERVCPNRACDSGWIRREAFDPQEGERRRFSMRCNDPNCPHRDSAKKRDAATTQQRLSQAEECLRKIADHPTRSDDDVKRDPVYGVGMQQLARAYFHPTPNQGESE